MTKCQESSGEALGGWACWTVLRGLFVPKILELLSQLKLLIIPALAGNLGPNDFSTT
jgi:hypothetical protein